MRCFLILLLFPFIIIGQTNLCQDIELLILKQTGGEQSIENAIYQYQSDSPLSSANINVSTVSLSPNQDACLSMSELLEDKDVALFVGGAY